MRGPLRQTDEHVEIRTLFRHQDTDCKDQRIHEDKASKQTKTVKYEKIQEGDRKRDIEVPPKESFIYCVLQVHGLSPENPFYCFDGYYYTSSP